MTVRELLKFCQKAVTDGLGDKQVYISQDDEGNGFHKLYYEFTTSPDDIKDLLGGTYSRLDKGDSEENVILLG